MTGYPTPEQVEAADVVALARWSRHLPSPGMHAIGRDDFQDVLDREAAIAERISAVVNNVSVKGARLAPVETGNGTVLSAVFGTVQNGNRSCFFFPMIGITQA